MTETQNMEGGAAYLFISTYINFNIASKINVHEANLVCIDVHDIVLLKCTRIINVYCPPNFKNHLHFADFTDYLCELSNIDYSLVIIGDFNAPHITWKHISTSEYNILTLVVNTKSIFTEDEKRNVFADTFDEIFNKTIFDTSDIISSNNSKTLYLVPFVKTTFTDIL